MCTSTTTRAIRMSDLESPNPSVLSSAWSSSYANHNNGLGQALSSPQENWSWPIPCIVRSHINYQLQPGLNCQKAPAACSFDCLFWVTWSLFLAAHIGVWYVSVLLSDCYLWISQNLGSKSKNNTLYAMIQCISIYSGCDMVFIMRVIPM